MKVPPKKPHFFKPILPGFKDELTIPIGFFKYLKENRNEYAMLRRASKKWPVKVNGRRLVDGWEEFVKDHDLQLGDILIFRHEGDMEFEVAVFDSSYCEREYEQGVHEREEEKVCIVEESSKKLKFKEKPKPKIKTSGKAFSNVEAAKEMHLSRSHFICTIRPYCFSKHCLCIPKKIAQENRLNDRKCMIIMRHEQRTWTLSVYTSGKNTYIGSGWREFCTTNCLKEGDRLMLEIVSNGETPIFRFHDLRGSPSLQAEVKKENLDAKRMSDKADLGLKTSDVTSPKSQLAASTSADANPHFISTIKPYTIKYPILYLPTDFLKSNGLMNKSEMILVGEKQRSWSVWLGRTGRHFGITRGWPQFRKANGVQVGDTYKFELTNNGTIPIVHFRLTDLRLKTSDVTTPISKVAASTSADAKPHFISTIKPYTMRSAVLFIPMDFVKSNGLMNRSEMILIDEKQRSWSVWLGRTEGHFGITRGWRQFIKANGVQVGDTCKFELTNNGTIPIVHFHCKYSGN